ncbi:PAS domain-containing protein [Streptomyces tanashiensis]|uniref:PAS domain-containing protein n=1 Tax=Streptomyces tanashiensis TaxID=67367 RepID=A0ABY6R7J0_9ACTN|nr:PAS domain-containing protein [Streptomyces tanashiensis]UZX26045.1 PAS domain-containing protein [Streptomyces tanashiensis]
MVPPLPRDTVRLTAILDALPDGLVLVDGNGNGTVVNANTVALGMFETPGTALVGRGLLDLLPGADSHGIPGSVCRPGPAGERGRTRPVRMTARRNDGGAFPVEVTGASLEGGLEAYDASSGYTGDGLLVLVVRDLTGTLDAEAELARSRRQTEMILRAAAEGVVGTDIDGRVVLVNPAFTRILGYDAGELGGAELHPLILARRADGSPFPYEESPLADTLRSGHKHRVRGQVLWSKGGERVPVDLTTAPVREGDRLVGAVMAFTDRRPYEQLIEKYTAELADRAERHAAERQEQEERYAALAARHAELTAALGDSLRGEPDQRVEGVMEPLQRRTAAVKVTRHPTTLGTVVNAGIDKASALTGSHRTQFAVHAPPVVVTLDPTQTSTALAHLIADAAGVTSAGKAHRHSPSTSQADPTASQADTTVVITAALRGGELRIEICGPRAVNDAAHMLVARGIIDAHGGVLTAREHPRASGLTYIVQIPHTPPHAPAARSPLPPVQAPVAGSWIIGAAVSARRDRAAAAVPAAPPSPSAALRPTAPSGRPRPYAVPLPHSRAEHAAATARPAPPTPASQRAERVPRWAENGTDDVAQQRIVHLLARIRRQSA